MTLERMSDEEILHIANPIMDNLMDASTAIDHARHIRDFSDRMKTLVTRSTFGRSVRNISERKAISRGGNLSPCSNVLAQRRLSGSSGSHKRQVNSLPKCSSSKKMVHFSSIT